MENRKHYHSLKGLLGLGFIFLVTSLYAQEVESKAVGFYLDNKPDLEAPIIKILSPTLNDNNLFSTEFETVELIGEVADESEIRFVSINSDILEINSKGIFAKSITLSQGVNIIQIKAMDELDNLSDRQVFLQYAPPVITLADRINEKSRYYGLVIGIDNYRDPEIPDLDNPIKDAQGVYRSLTTNYTFEPDDVTFMKNPKRSEIIGVLDGLRGKITENDNLLIFYAGHGFWDEDAGIGYWLPSDATTGTTADWFRNSTLVDYLQAIHSRHTLLITDACFAGSIFKARTISLDKEVVYDRIYEIPSRKAMTSGAMTEVPDKSAFVKYLIQRLDENEETYLSSEELFSSFRMAVISNSSVLPQYGEIHNVGNEGGDFIFLKRQ